MDRSIGSPNSRCDSHQPVPNGAYPSRIGGESQWRSLLGCVKPTTLRRPFFHPHILRSGTRAGPRVQHRRGSDSALSCSIAVNRRRVLLRDLNLIELLSYEVATASLVFPEVAKVRKSSTRADHFQTISLCRACLIVVTRYRR
jgi:hypothetical protein